MQEFVPGQRWICDADLQMGLGTVLSVDDRLVTMAFNAVDETRTYARQSAPLTRMLFSEGDDIPTADGGMIHVQSISEIDGLLIYEGLGQDGTVVKLPETAIADQIKLNRPVDRLVNNQFDDNKWFTLRYETLVNAYGVKKDSLYGLTGCRTSLIPHQLYIAHEVANRYAPRVLLADEVGLGKTIEAGLILHQQLLTERAQRVLIIVPGPLLHQWLVEMMRRFNLLFSVFDEERCEETEAGNEGENPFHSEQLILCTQEFLTSNSDRYQQAIDGEWDLLVVDEAHHLHWSPGEVSIEYQMVEGLAMRTKGVLLLTATPEQLGKESHFARLRLLDPDRFSDFETFIKEEKAYQPVADGVEALIANRLDDIKLDKGQQPLLLNLKSMDRASEEYKTSRDELINKLLDQHGTGRVLFRNTRAAVKGFPRRYLHAYPLTVPDAYKLPLEDARQRKDIDAQDLLCPELLYGKKDWTRIDRRVDWLVDELNVLKPAKVLLITVNRNTAIALSDWLKLRAGINSAVFHEGMTMIERDRAAAYFADQDQGCQVLVCSEIGSEGRNFQFAHHLVLFDLPLNPDLLEQRIGRLDRIGQAEAIQIHVPYFEESAQAVMFHWYHEGLQAFESTCPAGYPVFNQLENELIAALTTANVEHHEIPELVEKTQSIYEEMNQMLQQGRDRLLEYNSCRVGIARSLTTRAEKQDTSSVLEEYMDKVFDCFGVNSEDHGKHNYIISPGEHMVSQFTGLYDEGMTVTFNRDIALSNEDMHFLTWEHPMVMNAIDMVMTSEFGNSVVISIEHDEVNAGMLLVETLYLIDVPPVKGMQADRFFPTGMLRMLIDEKERQLEDIISYKSINQVIEYVPNNIARQVVQMKEKEIDRIIKLSEQKAQNCLHDIITTAQDKMNTAMKLEINRLRSLSELNKNIRPEEIRFFQELRNQLNGIYARANLRLEAIRVIVAT